MNKKIWCVIADDFGGCGNNIQCFGCYTTKEEAEKASEYWDEDYYCWVEETEVYSKFKEPV